jgi:ABC-type oligopeptide transport system substrate-binding subunit
MEVQIQDVGVMWDRFGQGDFEAAFHNHQPGPEPLRRDFGPDNRHGYRNPEVARLTEQAVATADPDELDAIYRALTEVLRADLPMTRLVPTALTSVAHRRVRGPSASRLAMPDMYMDEL